MTEPTARRLAKAAAKKGISDIYKGRKFFRDDQEASPVVVFLSRKRAHSIGKLSN